MLVSQAAQADGGWLTTLVTAFGPVANHSGKAALGCAVLWSVKQAWDSNAYEEWSRDKKTFDEKEAEFCLWEVRKRISQRNVNSRLAFLQQVKLLTGDDHESVKKDYDNAFMLCKNHNAQKPEFDPNSSPSLIPVVADQVTNLAYYGGLTTLGVLAVKLGYKYYSSK